MVDRSRWVKSWTVASRPAESRVFDLGHPAHPPAVRPGRKERKATCQLSKLGDTLEHRPVRSPALRGVCRARGKEEILWPAQRRGPDRTGLLLAPRSRSALVKSAAEAFRARIGHTFGLSRDFALFWKIQAVSGLFFRNWPAVFAPAHVAAPRGPENFSLVLDPLRLDPVLPFSFFRTRGMWSIPALLGHIIALHDLSPLAFRVLFLMAGPA